jgi:nitrous oxidase accessory protein NosD
MRYFRWIFGFSMAALVLFSTTWAVPLNESFSYPNFPPIGWQTLQNGDGAKVWDRSTSYTLTTPGCARSDYEDLSVGLVSKRWLIAPQLSVDNATDSVTFWVRTYYSFVVGDDSLFVLVSTSGSNPADFTDLLGGYDPGSGGNFDTAYVRYAHSLESYVGEDIYIAFLHTDPDDGDNRVYMDNVTGPELLEAPQPPSSPQPADGAVSIGPDTVLHWTNGVGTDSVDLYLATTEDSVLNKEPAARKVFNQLVELYDPPGDLQSNQIFYWRVVTKNQFGSTDGDVWDFTVIGAPLAGSYDIGGGNNDYNDFNEAVSALESNGISASVTFNVYGTTYYEYLVIHPITGASATDTILFRDASGTARITYDHYLGASDGIVRLDNADYITFDGIDIAAVDSAFKCVSVHNGATYNRFQNATFTQDLSGLVPVTTSVLYCVYIWGAQSNYNILDHLTLKAAKTGVYMASATVGNVVQNCVIDSVWRGVYVDNGTDIHIRDNDIELDRAGNTGSAWGLEVGSSFPAGNTINFYRNKVHNIVSSSSSGSGMVRTYGEAGALNRIHNNFCYDFQTIGSAQVRGIYVSGDSEIYFNSIRINDVASTGTVYAVYLSAYNRTENIRNNIFYNGEATATAYNLYASSSSYFPDVLDYNAYYGSGTGYNLASLSSTYANLAALRNGTTYEDHGVEGDPGFTSATDLHILNTAALVHNNGVAIAGISDDFDLDARLITPDIGADEYTYLAPAADYAAREFIGVQLLYPELTPMTIQVYVQNRGSSAQTDVPVRLFYKNVQQDEILVSLDAYGVDTLAFDWTTPAARDTGILKAQCFLGGDAVPANDSIVTQVVVIGQPMHGTYDIGGGANHYANFTLAVDDIRLRGMDGAVTFDVYGTTYAEAISIPEIPGASPTNTVSFLEHTALDEPVVITYGSGSGTVQINGSDYITFDGIDIVATGSNTRALSILGGADYNVVKNCNITGAAVSGSSNYGAYVSGGGNDYNKLQNVTVSGGYYGVRISGTSSAADVGNEMTDCAVTEGKYGVYSEYQYNLRVHDCDIQVGWSGAATEVYGLYVGSHSASCTTYFYANEIHNLRTSGSAASNGIYTSSSSGRLMAYNNFIYDFLVTGTGALYGLRVPGGNAELYFNSVYIGDVGTTGGSIGINGFFEAGSSTNVILTNNIIQVSEPTVACWGINRSAGILTSNYNCFYGTGAAYNMGRDATTAYATLALWQGATGRDANSVEGNPGFVSAINLHIHPSFDLVDSAGVAIPGITDDVDHNLRAGVPDIGADEYTYISIPHDLGVNGFADFVTVYDANLPYVIKVEVENYGANSETDVPVVLFYDGTPQDTVLLTLPFSQKDTVELDWLTPNVEFQQGVLEVQVFCPLDNYLDNDSVTADVTVIAGPMSGTYDLGGGSMDFANFAEAVTSLMLRGIDGPVTIDCYAGTYQENIGVPEIDGASFADRITFQAHGRDVVTLTAAAGDSILSLNGADYLIFDGINVTATGAANTSILLRDDADFNTFKNLTVRGRDSLSSSVRGVRIRFLSNDNNLFDGLTVAGCYYGIRNEGGGSYDSSFALEIRHCTILNARYGVYLDNVHNALVHDNDIQPGSDADNNAHTYGIYISSLEGSHVAYIYNNRIHNLRNGYHTSFPTVAAIETHPTGNAQAYIYNNFIYDFIVPNAEIHGIHIGSGTSHIYHNSIRLNDVDATYETVGIYLSTGTGELVNNIIVVEEATDTCYAIWRYGGAVLSNSDYNCFYGTSPEFRVGRDGATDCPTLPDWQGFGYDPNSIVGDPGFVSTTDLHIDPVNSLVDSAGVYLASVATDIDGDERDDPPDIGADEYDWVSPPGPITNLTVFRETGTDNVILRWSAVLNANSYNIYAGDSVGFVVGPSTYVGTTENTAYTHTGVVLAANMKFYVVLASSSLPGAVVIPPAENRRDR